MSLRSLCDFRRWQVEFYSSPLFFHVSLLCAAWEIFPRGSEACS